MAPRLTRARIEEVLDDLATDPPPPGRTGARAAVAMVLRFEENGPHVLLMKRAERRGDRWSGQISLPGGREEGGDGDLLTTAVRETHEEVGLDLGRSGRLLGRLHAIQARARGVMLPMTIDPFVFERTEDAPLTLGEEAVETFWFPLAEARNGTYASTFELQDGDATRTLPCWRFEGRVIWGLTFEMLRGFLRVVGGHEDLENHDT